MIIGHGDDLYSQKNQVKYNFSSNVDRHQDYSALRNFLKDKLDAIHSYPEPAAESLMQTLADQLCIDSKSLLVTNGATEAIYLIAQAFENARTGVLIPTFSEYEDACVINNHHLSFYQSLDDIPADLELMWICNPNNPTGTIFEKEQLTKIIQEHDKTLFIIDQSYEYFSQADVFEAQEAQYFHNLILLHSMTKHFSIPGLRLGYITAQENVIAKINRFKMPWSVNQLAIEAGKYLLTQHINRVNITTHLEETNRFRKELEQFEEFEVFPTKTHFFLVKIKGHKASQLKSYLVEQHGILIRDAANFRGLDAHYFRVASQTEEENNIFIQAIKTWITTF